MHRQAIRFNDLSCLVGYLLVVREVQNLGSISQLVQNLEAGDGTRVIEVDGKIVETQGERASPLHVPLEGGQAQRQIELVPFPGAEHPQT
jgi:hypothetical protein